MGEAAAFQLARPREEDGRVALPDSRVGLPEQLLPRGVLQADGLGTVGVHRKGQKFVLNGRLHFQYLLCPSYFPGPAVSSILPRVPKINACTNRHWAEAFTPCSPDRGKPFRKHDFHALLASTGLCQRQGDDKGSAVFAAASTVTLPPCSTAISRTRARPSPTPPISRLRDLSTRKKGWKMLSPAVCGDARAGIRNARTAVCFSRRRVTRTAPSGGYT